jgi:predicted permease
MWFRLHKEIDEEIRAHLQMARHDREERGESPAEADRRARAEFGNPLLVQEVTRDVHGWTAFDSMGQDIRYGLRQMRRSPGFCAIAVVTLAFGIGVNTTMFSLVNALLFQPMHAKNPEQIVAVFSSVNPAALYGSSSYPDYVDIRDRSIDVFQDLAAFTLLPVDLKIGEGAQHLTAGVVTGNYFPLLGAGPRLGRTFAVEEDRPFDPRRVVVLSERMWRERLGADPAIAGKTIRLNKQAFTVIGVMDSRFCRLRHFFEVDLFVPTAARELLSGISRSKLDPRNSRQFFLLGRLASGVGLKKAQSRLRLIASQLHQEQPDAWTDSRGRPGSITAVSERDSRVPPQARLGVVAFSIFVLAIVGTVLLIACTNLANLSLAKALSRRTEIAVRVSVGASRWRLVRQLLVESLLLSSVGACAAMLLTRLAVGLAAAYRPPMEVALGLDLLIDTHVLLFAALVTLVTTLVFGLAPALHATGADVVTALKESGAPGPYRRYSFRSVLIVAEVALSIVLLMPSGLFWRSLENFKNLDLGFRRDHLALVSITLDGERYSPERGNLAYRQIAERLRRVPGVVQADFASTVPLSGVSNAHDFSKEGSEQPRSVESNTVGPRYFETMGIRFLRGKGFDEARPDRAVAVVNAALARAFWPGEEAVGKRIVGQGETASIEVIGVVGTGKYASVSESPTPYLYRPMGQEYSSSATFHIRTKLPAGEMLVRLSREIQAYDPGLPVFDAKTMEDQLAFTVAPYEAVALTLGAFGVLAIVIAFAGLYGLIAYQTAVRTREIGIRVALGANPRDILSLMVREGLGLVLVGIAAGVPASIGIALLIGKFLFGVAPLDPETFLAVPAVMGIVAAAAIAIPAARSMRIEPWNALRTT